MHLLSTCTSYALRKRIPVPAAAPDADAGCLPSNAGRLSSKASTRAAKHALVLLGRRGGNPQTAKHLLTPSPSPLRRAPAYSTATDYGLLLHKTLVVWILAGSAAHLRLPSWYHDFAQRHAPATHTSRASTTHPHLLHNCRRLPFTLTRTTALPPLSWAVLRFEHRYLSYLPYGLRLPCCRCLSHASPYGI